MKKKFQPVFDFILFSNIFMALCAVAQGLVTFYLIAVKPIPQVIFLLFFSTILVYSFGILIKKPENQQQSPHKRIRWFFANYRLMATLTTVAFLSLIPIFFQLSIASQILLVFLSVLSLIYSIPLFSSEGKKIAIRNLPGLKQFLIVSIWTISCVLVPVLEAENHGFTTVPLGQTFILIAERLLFFGALTIPFDIRDLFEDNQTGVKTIPVIWGEKNALLLCQTLLICYMALLLILSNNRFNSIFWALASTVILAGWLIFLFKWKKNEYYYFFCIDGLLVVQYLLLVLFHGV